MSGPGGVVDLFATPMLVSSLPDFAVLNAQLRASIMARRATHPGLAHSNINGWHSDTDLLDWGGPAARHVANAFGVLAMRQTRDLASPAAPRFSWQPKMWANISEAGAANAAHAHPGAYWSGVYYVDDGGCGADPALGGELCLIDPRYPLVQQAAPDLGYCGADGKPLRADQLLRPAPGMLVGFPSWLQHSVRPYRGTGTRISIAINLSVVPHGR
ncbi:MAG: TIGR02466 family protein [Polymorphobacter sp.]